MEFIPTRAGLEFEQIPSDLGSKGSPLLLSGVEEFGGEKFQGKVEEGFPKISLSLGIPSLAKEKDPWHQDEACTG
ncbi:hypothetical protein DUI87_28432 [Hirundo rustica rustica]|uniref:Uncharacterized protein n=1 Tax=Hirundo rustica rustica TaxID=333673 RepID=A0A3M0JK20_HIRRU|nr:hypothetical protein DUI87_28432 [Hirundo rustica rustica]